jgi:hypothetical protein
MAPDKSDEKGFLYRLREAKSQAFLVLAPFLAGFFCIIIGLGKSIMLVVIIGAGLIVAGCSIVVWVSRNADRL